MNTESYRDAFLEEAVENIGNLNRALLSFEKETGDLTPVNELFRAAHTLKGMSATMGYDRMAEFTHMLEEVLDHVRSGTLAAERPVIDTLFLSIDVLQEFVDTIRDSGVDNAAEAKNVIAKLKSLSGKEASAAAPHPGPDVPAPQKTAEQIPAEHTGDITVDRAVVEEAAKQGLKTYTITVNIARTCAFKAVRAFMISRNLSEKGEIVASEPPARDIEEGKFENVIKLGYVSGAAAADISAMVTRIAEVESAKVTEIKLQPPATAKEGAGYEDAAEERDKGTEAMAVDKKAAAVSQSVRVNVEKLDSMMNLVGELVITKIRLDQIMKTKDYDQLPAAAREFDRVIDELQIEVTDIRMLPVSHVFDRYPR
ncbi:MAG: Hpt domain-containing protein, partial [Spirochaetia bacterium]|nr:Hpt domain-containing protein [Spirochaetia bacterium]